MADFIDIILARAMTPQGKTETYVAKANKAAAKAAQAEADAQAAIDVVTAASDTITAVQEQAADLLEAAQDALETAQAAQINTLDTEDVDEEIKKLDVSINTVSGNAANTIQMITTYPDNTLNTENITKLYKSTGDNEDGTMTQKAITNALGNKANITYVDTSIQELRTIINNSGGTIINPSGGTIDLGSINAKHIIIVSNDGGIVASSITERALIEALIKAGVYIVEDAVGLEMDYENKSMNKTQDAAYNPNYNNYKMYGGRRRCNVADDGTINAFYGEAGYTEDGSNGQVMVYQPKFYYQRIPIKTEDTLVGKIIRKESLMITEEYSAGFKIHPLFINENGEEVDYVLLSAYEGCIFDTSASNYLQDDQSGVDFNEDKLSSIANVKPTSGKNNSFTLENAERAAQNRGAGWHITNMEVESANQMLEMLEFGTMNMQSALGMGIVNIDPITGQNMASNTGSTASLGNASGRATSTTNKSNGTTRTYTETNKTAISYRGVENPWGNIWKFVGGATVHGDSHLRGGMMYICKNFNYNYSDIDSNYAPVGFTLPSSGGYISAMGYGDEDYDWVFVPTECASTANSAVPIGDSLWTVSELNGNVYTTVGGTSRSQETGGPFYYGCDRALNNSSVFSTGARLMFKPTKNEIYTANISKWQTEMGV